SLLAILIVMVAIFSAQAQMPTKEQSDQFKPMTSAQQEALARSMGIDLKDYEYLLKQSGQTPDSYERQVSGRRVPLNNQYYSDQQGYPRQPYPDQQPYSGQQSYPGQQSYSGQQSYP